MDTVFPDMAMYRGWCAPLRLESDIRDLPLVHGEVPKDLRGVLYRCGPDRQYPPMTGDDVFIDAGKNMGTANTNIVWHGRKLRGAGAQLRRQARGARG
jgi:carotenoid cleavage dioxygenase-like enzyme